MKLRNLIYLPAAACAFSGIMGCTDEINNYEKQTPAEASNKVFVSEKYASLAFVANRTVTGEVDNLDTLVAKLVVNCTSPAGGDLSVRVSIDTLLVDIYNRKHESSYHQFLSNWIRLNRSTLTIPEGSTESDTLTVALRLPLNSNNLASTDGYIMPIRITSASGYDAQVDYDKRVSYLTLDVTQENGVGFVEGENSGTVAGNADFTGYDLPLMLYMASTNDINVKLEIDNDEVPAFNKKYGTSFGTLLKEDLEIADVTLPAGSINTTGHIVYKGDMSQLAGTNYLVPIKIKSASESGAETVKTLRTDMFYLVINAVSEGYTLETEEATLGVRQTDRTAYKAISAEEYSFTVGNWDEMFKSSLWVLNGVKSSVTIDLGYEVQNITGIYIRANNSSMSPKSMDISYAGEELYEVTRLSVNLGSVELPKSCEHMYFKFAKPVTARYLGLNNMIPKSQYYACKDFYIYTQE